MARFCLVSFSFIYIYHPGLLDGNLGFAVYVCCTVFVFRGRRDSIDNNKVI